MNKTKIYLAMRFAKIEDYKLKLLQLKDLEFEISHDWSLQNSIKQYFENKKVAAEYTQDDIDGVLNADIFILISEKEKDARGCNMEFGIALGNINKYKEVIILNESHDDAMFFYHEKVKLVRNWENVLEILKIYE
jgi:antitoxin component YwqK of YwqJK toxin-antitoxin module